MSLDHTPNAKLLGGKGAQALSQERANSKARRKPAHRVSVSLPRGKRSPAAGP